MAILNQEKRIIYGFISVVLLIVIFVIVSISSQQSKYKKFAVNFQILSKEKEIDNYIRGINSFPGKVRNTPSVIYITIDNGDQFQIKTLEDYDSKYNNILFLVKVGDRIYKNKNSDSLFVYKGTQNDTVLFILN